VSKLICYVTSHCFLTNSLCLVTKPDKYGIKFWVLVEVASKFIFNIVPYFGAQKYGRGCVRLAESVIVKLLPDIT